MHVTLFALLIITAVRFQRSPVRAQVRPYRAQLRFSLRKENGEDIDDDDDGGCVHTHMREHSEINSFL